MEAKAYRFGEWIVEPHLNRVSSGERTVEVEPTTMDVLSFMLEHPGEILSIDQFLETVWQGRVVEPNAVHRNITMLRRALGEDAQNPRYIGNVRKRGYRTLAAVTTLAEHPEPTDTNEGRDSHTSAASRMVDAPSVEGHEGPSTTQMRVTAMAVIALVAIGWWILASEREPDTTTGVDSIVDMKSVAVLPFTDMSPEGDQQYFGDGIAEAVLNEITGLKGLRVASRAASVAYWQSGEDFRTLAAALNVITVLHGSVRKSGDRLRITAQLINVEDGSNLWSDSFDREVTDVFAIQDEIAARVAAVLGVTLGVGDANAFRGAGTDSIEAYESYLRAMSVARGREPERDELLRRAIELDPDYAAALAALGLAIAGSSWRNPPERAPVLFEAGSSFLLRAVEVEPDSSYANRLLAVANYATFDWRGSESYFMRSYQVRPNGLSLEDFGNMHLRAGRISSAITYFEAASNAERDPVTAVGRFDIHARVARADFAGARRLLDQGPLEATVDAATVNYEIALNQGDSTELKEAFEQLAPGSSPIASHLAPVMQVSDSPEAALGLLRQIYADSSAMWPSKYHDIAHLAAFFGDPDFALQVASKEAKLMTNRYPSLLWYPVMAEARKLPEFLDLVTEVNLVAYWREHGWSDY